MASCELARWALLVMPLYGLRMAHSSSPALGRWSGELPSRVRQPVGTDTAGEAHSCQVVRIPSTLHIELEYGKDQSWRRYAR